MSLTKHLKSDNESGENEETEAGEDFDEILVFYAPFLDCEDCFAFADGDLENDHREGGDKNVEKDCEDLGVFGEGEDTVRGGDYENNRERHFAASHRHPERKRFDAVVGIFCAFVYELCEAARNPKFGSGAFSVVEEPDRGGHEDEEGDENYERGGREAAGENHEDEEASRGEGEGDEEGDAENVFFAEVLGFLFYRRAEGGVIESEESADAELESGVDQGCESDYG